MIDEKLLMENADKILSIVNNEGVAEIKTEYWKDGKRHLVIVEQSRKIRAEKEIE